MTGGDQDDPTPYYRLDPDRVMLSIESLGLRCDGRLLALNSYENRVYQVGMEEGPPLVAKFYRPGRWSDAQILEEHAFSLELAEAEIPLIPPLVIAGGTLHHEQGFRFALFTRRGGHSPELDQQDTRRWLGRFLGRIHAVGAIRRFDHRPDFEPLAMAAAAVRVLQDGDWLPLHLQQAFDSLCRDLLQVVANMRDAGTDWSPIRIHGDCHPGNILWRDGPFFVDLDDCRNGPAIQDVWMLLSGEPREMVEQLQDIVAGYRQFNDLDTGQLQWIEVLRTLRMLHYAAWIARRWQDPAFPLAFPWFDETRYWEDLILSLREQLSRMLDSAYRLMLD
jgi:Ser/Thr protein kinase RdoA (MazF antagonist)